MLSLNRDNADKACFDASALVILLLLLLIFVDECASEPELAKVNGEESDIEASGEYIGGWRGVCGE